MEYISVAQMAKKWGISERSVRNYCAQGRIADAKLIGKTWYIPEDAQIKRIIHLHYCRSFVSRRRLR